MRGVVRKHNMAKKKTTELHTCFECANAYLMQSIPVNPIVSECTITREREVASTLIRCEQFKPLNGKVEIYPMINLK